MTRAQRRQRNGRVAQICATRAQRRYSNEHNTELSGRRAQRRQKRSHHANSETCAHRNDNATQEHPIISIHDAQRSTCVQKMSPPHDHVQMLDRRDSVAAVAHAHAPFDDQKVGEHRRHAVEGARLRPDACAERVTAGKHGKKGQRETR